MRGPKGCLLSLTPPFQKEVIKMSTSVKGDRQALKRTMEAIIAKSQRHAARQPELPGLNGPAQSGGDSTMKVLPERIAELVYNVPAKRRLEDLFLQADIVEEVEEFIHEYAHSALLRANSLEPRHTILLVGPPGNGKTSLAEAFATELSLPLLSIRYDAIVDSFLGETSNRLRKLIDYATLNPCVLFFDEFDAVGKERSDAQETGEIKRVVSSLLVQMDHLPSHTLIVCATNHPELLDRAVWRRFELKLDIERPDRSQLKKWFSRFSQSLNNVNLGVTPDEFAEYMDGENMSEVEAFTLDVRRKIILSKGRVSAAEAVLHVLTRLKKRPITNITSPESHGEQLSDNTPQARPKSRATNKGAETAVPRKNSVRKAASKARS
jgi:SpoVK/Ycf46/Vps4 family AAA+-type ATPase